LMGADLLMPGRFLQGTHLARFAAEHSATFAAAVPAVLSDMSRSAVAEGRDLSALALVIGGGSAVSQRLIDDWQDVHGGTLLQAWGMTETSPVAAIARPPRSASSDDGWRLKTGRPIPGVELRVVNDDGIEVPADGASVGELQARGPWVTAAYYQGRSSSSFVDGWLRTGDVGHIDRHRYVRLTDRAKDVIKSGGEWISSLALEDALMRHPCVVEAGVIGVDDERWQERPLACVVLARRSDPPSFEDLAASLLDQVPRWWVPERWVSIEALPRTSVGKIDKIGLRHDHAVGRWLVETIVVPRSVDEETGAEA